MEKNKRISRKKSNKQKYHPQQNGLKNNKLVKKIFQKNNKEKK